MLSRVVQHVILLGSVGLPPAGALALSWFLRRKCGEEFQCFTGGEAKSWNNSPESQEDCPCEISRNNRDYYKECEGRVLLDLPNTFPPRWVFDRRLVPVMGQLLPETPLRSVIPQLPPQGIRLPEIESDRRHFWNLLVGTMPRVLIENSKRRELDSGSHPIQILDVGCGRGWDAVPLHSFFGRKPYGIPGENVHYLGVDNDSSQIYGAKHDHQERPDLVFDVADASEFERSSSLRGRQFDVIVVRHPEVFVRRGGECITSNWFNIFRESFEHLAPSGIILVTTYRCGEHMGADEALRCVGAQRIFTAKNPFSARISLYGGLDFEFRDPYVAVYSR